MTAIPISARDYAALLHTSSDAFRMEYQEHPLAGEQIAYEQFAAGVPWEPGEWAEWGGWLERVQDMTSHGKTVSRVCILSDPVTMYQQWRIWGAPWHYGAGEDLRFLTFDAAFRLGIRAFNWWLFNDEMAVTMAFQAGRISSLQLISGPETDIFRACRDLALPHAVPAQALAA